MVLGYNEFEGFDRRKNNIMGPIEHFYTGEETVGGAETATATEGGAETATATEGGAATATNPVADQVTGESTFNTILSDYTYKKINFNSAVSIYNPEQENNISDI